MELVLVHITDIHLENDTDYNILEGRSEYIANAINKHIIDCLLYTSRREKRLKKKRPGRQRSRLLMYRHLDSRL